MRPPRQQMPSQDPFQRKQNFNEVNLGLGPKEAMLEASRCLQCKQPLCVQGCPVEVKIDSFIAFIREGKFLEASNVIWKDNRLPAICGRVCPQESQCENKCILGRKGDPVAIGALERFAADEARKLGIYEIKKDPPKEKSVAVVGSGPAGLSCAGDLAQMGYKVEVLEAFHEIGGVLSYGIPEFRLPKAIIAESKKHLEGLGVKFRTNIIVGMTETVGELLSSGFDALFIATGAGLPYFLDIPGENLLGVYSANEFLTRVNLMKSYSFPETDTPIMDIAGKRLCVFGGGNTALDAARCAVRLGARHVSIVYRRSSTELPARKEEIKHALEEGVEFTYLVSPHRFSGNEDGILTGVELQRMELGEPDASGRRRPVPIEGGIYSIRLDAAIIAIGNGSNPIIEKTTPGLSFDKRGHIKADPISLATSIKGVYAGGDIVTGAATVILAMGAGRRAAKAIDSYLSGK